MSEPKQSWDRENVQAVTLMVFGVAVVAGLVMLARSCVDDDVGRARLQSEQLKAGMNACHAACVPGQVRSYENGNCVCD